MNAFVAKRVTNGAAFLDEHDPDWWRADADRAISLDRLDLRAMDSCVLGQRCPVPVLAAYIGVEIGTDDEPDELSSSDWCQAYRAYAVHLAGGFDGIGLAAWAAVRGFCGRTNTQDEYDALTAEWRKIITERRAAA